MQQNLTEPQTKVLTGNLPYLKSVVGYTAENYYIIPTRLYKSRQAVYGKTVCCGGLANRQLVVFFTITLQLAFFEIRNTSCVITNLVCSLSLDTI